MLKSEVERMVKMAGGMMEIEEVNVNGRTFKVGQTKETIVTQKISEIIGFAPPSARGRIDKWDDNADVPSVIIRNSGNIHPSAEFEIKMVLDF